MTEVMLYGDLALLNGVETRRLNELDPEKSNFKNSLELGNKVDRMFSDLYILLRF